DRLEILADARIVLLVAPVAGKASAEGDALEPELLAQPLPRLVEPPPDAVALAAGIDADLDAIEPFALGVVQARIARPGDVLPGVLAENLFFAQLQRCRVADDLPVEDGDELALGEGVDLAPDGAGEVWALLGIDALGELDDFRDVADFRVPHFEERLVGKFGHGRSRWVERRGWGLMH